MFGAEYRAGMSKLYRLCVPMAWSSAKRRSTLPFGPAARVGRPDHTRTTRGPQAYHKQILETSHETDPCHKQKRPTRTTRGPQRDHKRIPRKKTKRTCRYFFSGREAQSTRRYIPKKISIYIYIYIRNTMCQFYIYVKTSKTYR